MGIVSFLHEAQAPKIADMATQQRDQRPTLGNKMKAELAYPVAAIASIVEAAAKVPLGLIAMIASLPVMAIEKLITCQARNGVEILGLGLGMLFAGVESLSEAFGKLPNMVKNCKEEVVGQSRYPRIVNSN